MSESLSGGAEFELVYEGPADESPDTLRRLKGVFIADLELSVDEVQHILAHAPLAIKTAGDSKSLESYYRTLKTAGAKVLIVRKKLAEDSPGLEQAEDLIQQALSDPSTLEAESNAADNEIEIEFQFEDDFDIEDEQVNEKIEKGAIKVPEDNEAVLGVAYQKSDSSGSEAKSADSEMAQPKSSTASNSSLFQFVDTSTLTAPESDAETMPLITSPAGTEASIPHEEEDIGSHLNEISKSLLEIAEHDRPHKDPAAYSMNELEISFDDSAPASPPEPPKQPPPKIDLSLETEAKPEPLPVTVLGLAETKPNSPPPLSMANPAPTQPQASSPPVAQAPPPPPPEVIPESELGFTPISRDQIARRQKTGFNWDTFAWIAGGAVVLVLGNYLYFSSRDPQVSEEQVAHLKAASQLATNALNEDDPLGVKSLRNELNVTHGSKKSGDVSVDWKITLIENKPDAISIVLTTPEPPQRTKEQIVRQDPGLPWLSKIEILALPLTFEGKENFMAQGPVKAFITYADQKFRTIANATIKGSFHEVDRTALGNIDITLENTGAVEREHHGEGFAVAVLDNKKFRVTIKANF